MGDDNRVPESLNLEEKQIKEAVSALFAYVKKDKGKKLIDEDEKVNLQLTFKKVPEAKNLTIKIPLPHGLYDLKENAEVCLFVKDLNKKERDYEPTVRHFKELLEQKNVKCISEIIPLKSLKTEYKPYEAKKNLSNKFDVYLSDARIIRLLPSQLGKHFYGRKRQPIQVNLTCKDLEKEINHALHDTRCIITGRGSNCMVTVGHTGMSEEDTVQNIMSAAQKLAESIPGGSINVRNLYVKTTSTPALPIYVSLGSANEVDLPQRERRKQEDEPEDVTTVVHGKVRVSPYGHVTIVNEPTTAKAFSSKKKKNATTTKNDNAKVKAKPEIQETEEEPPKKRSKMQNSKNSTVSKVTPLKNAKNQKVSTQKKTKGKNVPSETEDSTIQEQSENKKSMKKTPKKLKAKQPQTTKKVSRKRKISS